MKIFCWACIWVYFDLQWKHFKRITSWNHSAVRFFVENYDICWSTKKVWLKMKGTQSSRLWPIQQFFETVGSSFYDLSPLLPQIFVWVLILKKRHSNWVWFLFFFKTMIFTFILSWVTYSNGPFTLCINNPSASTSILTEIEIAWFVLFCVVSATGGGPLEDILWARETRGGC